MEQAASTFVYLVGISYVAVGIHLLRLASRTRGIPERFLGLAFLFDGISYGFSEIPFVFGVEGLLEELSFLGRIWAVACVIAVAVSGFEGDWEGMGFSPPSGSGWSGWEVLRHLAGFRSNPSACISFRENAFPSA